jgi:hypothetical protein
MPRDDDSAWASKDDPGVAKLVIRQFGTELGYVRLGTSTSICAEIVDASGASVEGARVAFVAHGAATIDPPAVMSNDVGSACATLTPHEAGSLHLQASATKDGYEPASAGKVAEVVDAPATASTASGSARPAPAAIAAGLAGIALLGGAALAARFGGGSKSPH